MVVNWEELSLGAGGIRSDPIRYKGRGQGLQFVASNWLLRPMNLEVDVDFANLRVKGLGSRLREPHLSKRPEGF